LSAQVQQQQQQFFWSIQSNFHRRKFKSQLHIPANNN
jgi:hypothetical protein